MVDLGTGNNNKINWALEDKQVRTGMGRGCNFPCVVDIDGREKWMTHEYFGLVFCLSVSMSVRMYVRVILYWMSHFRSLSILSRLFSEARGKDAVLSSARRTTRRNINIRARVSVFRIFVCASGNDN